MQSSLGGLDLDGAWSKDEHRFRVRGRLTGPASDLLSQSGQVFVRYFSFGDASGGHQYRPPLLFAFAFTVAHDDEHVHQTTSPYSQDEGRSLNDIAPVVVEWVELRRREWKLAAQNSEGSIRRVGINVPCCSLSCGAVELRSLHFGI